MEKTLFWYSLDNVNRKTCNAITIHDNTVIWSQATCSEKDTFIKALARKIASQRLTKFIEGKNIKSVLRMHFSADAPLEVTMRDFDLVERDPQNNLMPEKTKERFLGRVYNLLKNRKA